MTAATAAAAETGSDRGKKGFQKAIAKFGQYFKEQGLGAGDIPAAIVVHELIGLAMAAGFWTLCYRLQPAKVVGARLSGALSNSQAAQAAYNHAMLHATNRVRQMSWLTNNSRIDPARLTTSLAESLVLRATIKPATFVFKLWASYHLVRIGKDVFLDRYFAKGGNSGGGSGGGVGRKRKT